MSASFPPTDNGISKEQIQRFLKDGVLVVDNVLTHEQLVRALDGLAGTLSSRGVDGADLSGTGHNLRRLSSTNGSGGVLDIFYDTWKFEVATNPRLFHITTQLWKAAYCHEEGQETGLIDNTSEEYKKHPFGAFDTSRGFCYIDRICYRLPSALAEELGAKVGDPPEKTTKKKRKTVALQRSLTPHLDCCPENLFENKSKWRPIQCFVSLTENAEPSTGGFEAAKGFHREFADWAAHRPPSTIISRRKKGQNGDQPERISIPAPCIGEYTHIRPKEDATVLQRVQHIPVRAGSAVFWDNRIPHANSYRHLGTVPRTVVYCSFLPDVPVNRVYAERQLEKWRMGLNPTDQWIAPPTATREDELGSEDIEGQAAEKEKEVVTSFDEQINALSPLARRLLMVDPWENDTTYLV